MPRRSNRFAINGIDNLFDSNMPPQEISAAAFFSKSLKVLVKLLKKFVMFGAASQPCCMLLNHRRDAKNFISKLYHRGLFRDGFYFGSMFSSFYHGNYFDIISLQYQKQHCNKTCAPKHLISERAYCAVQRQREPEEGEPPDSFCPRPTTSWKSCNAWLAT